MKGVKRWENAIRFGFRINNMILGNVSLAICEGSYGMRVGRVGVGRRFVH